MPIYLFLGNGLPVGKFDTGGNRESLGIWRTLGTAGWHPLHAEPLDGADHIDEYVSR